MVSLPDELLARVDADAERHGLTRSAMLREYATAALEERSTQLARGMRALEGRATDDEAAVAEAAELAAEASRPVEDANGSIEYKANLVRVLVARSFREAVQK
jgi:metal-responsive CopG/Arc/MetJ family transcriptional regulator